MKTYRDWRCRATPGLGGGMFKARYRRPGSASWKGVSALHRRNAADKARADLYRMVREKG